MRIGVIGINHKLATLSLREKIAKTCSRRFSEISIHSKLSYITLSTCNRSEIYFHSDDLAQTHIYLLNILREGIEEEFEHRVYAYFGIDCFHHLARVTAGLDSAIIGETEIQGQVKQAYEEAMTHRKLSHELHFLFQKSLKIGKQIRTEFVLRQGMPTLEETIFHLMEDLASRRILFVGLSTINYKIFSWFKQKKINNITFCNRTPTKIKQFERSIHWDDLEERWIDFDLIIFGTKSPDFLIHAAPENLVERKLVIDLSVPRNVDPRVGRHSQIELFNIDQLTRLMEREPKLKSRDRETVENKVLEVSRAQMTIFRLKELQQLHALSKVI